MIHNLQKSSRIGKIHRVSFCGSRCFMCFTTKKLSLPLAKRCRLASVFAAPRMHQEIFPTSSSSFACFGMWYLQRKAHILFHQGVLHSTCLVQGGRQKSKAYHFFQDLSPRCSFEQSSASCFSCVKMWQDQTLHVANVASSARNCTRKLKRSIKCQNKLKQATGARASLSKQPMQEHVEA